MSLIINIRGANGSGKTTLAKSLLGPNPSITELVPRVKSMKKPIVASCAMNNKGHTIAVLGRYDTNCGGCDGYTWPGAHDQIEAAIEIAADRFPFVVFEGVTITSSYGRYRDLADRLWTSSSHETFWAMLDLPLSELVRRVQKRTPKQRSPEDTERLRDNIQKKVRTMELTFPKLLADPLVRKGGLDFERFDDTDAAKARLHSMVGL